MLKFLRKYQLILLAVGGSLLMVVFLLQPVLQQLTPDPRKRTVAMIGEKKVTMGDQISANQELDLLERFYPDLLTILGLTDEETRTPHWMLLKHEAERLGVMGVQRDGGDWIQELAQVVTEGEIRRRRQFGQPTSPAEAQEIAQIALDGLLQRREVFIERNRGLSPAAFDSVLSKARGVRRLQQLYISGPQLTRARAVDSMVEDGTMVLTDLVVIGPDAVMGEVGEPTEAEIASFFAEYRGTVPGNTDEADGGNPYGFGYTLPPRLKLEWLTLDRSAIAAVVQADPVVVRRRWQRENPDGGDFDADRGAIAEVVRTETIDRILTDADEIVRGEILNQTRELKKEGIYRVVPADWAAPDLETIAGDVVEAIQERHGVRIPRPRVQRRTDAWQAPADLFALPGGLGQAAFIVGNQRAAVYELPSLVRGVGEDTRVAVQPRVPIIDPPAVGQDGSRFYITVLEARGESPPDDLDEIRERIVENTKDKRAYDMLTERLASFREAAVSGGLEAAASLGASNGTPPPIATDIMVSNDRMLPTGASRPSPGANRPAFREAVVEAGSSLDPLADADSVDGPETVVLTPIPSAQSLVVAKVRAKRPPLLEEFRRMQGLVVGQRVRELVADAQGGTDPLGYAAMSDRLGYEEVGGGGDDDEDSAG